MTDDIELVIKIPKEKYEAIKSNSFPAKMKECFGLAGPALEAIRHGTPLPKGHGKLFDVNDILDRIGLDDNESNREDNVGEIVTLEDFDYIPTIIPADTESGGEE